MATASGRHVLENVIHRMNATWSRFSHRDPTLPASLAASRLAQDYPYLRDHALALKGRCDRMSRTWDDLEAAVRAVDNAFTPEIHRTPEQNTAIAACQQARARVDEVNDGR